MAFPKPQLFNAPGGGYMTDDEIKAARLLEQRRLMQGIDTSPVDSPLQGLARVAEAFTGALRRGQLDKEAQANQAYDASNYGSIPDALTGGTSGADSRYTTADASEPSTGRVTGSTNVSDPNIFTSFMDTVKAGGVNNPNALAAIASTGQHESGFSPKNVYGSWSDPSQSGRQLTAGGVMSWNGPRYEAMRNFVANAGGDPNKPDPTLQAQYFLKEDPDLIARLNQAKSPDEAQHLMNNAWRFAGYDRPGGEAGRRIASARMFVDKFGSAQQPSTAPVQIASLDPSIGMGSVQPQQTQVGDVLTVPSVETVASNSPQPVPMQPEQYQPTNADFTSDPRFSMAPNVPFETQGGGDYATPQIAAAIRAQPEVPASVKRISAALPIRPQADPNDVMVADMDHTEQPQQPTGQGTGTNYYPPAPIMDGGQPSAAVAAQQQSAPNTALLVRALTDPRASEKTRTLAKIVYEKQAAAATAAQKAEADRAQFVFEQQYAQNTPKSQQDLEKGKLEIEKLRNPTTQDITEYNFAKTPEGGGFTGTFPEWVIANKKAGAANQNVTVKSEQEQDKTIGAGLGKDLLTMIDDEKKSRNTISSLNAMEKEMTDPNFYSGSGGQTVANMKRFAASMGIDPDSVASTESFNALSKKSVLDDMGGSLGTGVSNADRDYIEGQVPTINNTPAGNKKIIDIKRKVNERKIKVAQMARTYAKAHDNRLDLDFYDQLGSWADNNPLFSKDETAAPAATIAPAPDANGWTDVPGGGRIQGAF